MKYCALALLFVVSTRTVAGQVPPEGTSAPVMLDGLGNLHHPVSTSNAEAQRFFDQGLRLFFAFNHEEARRSFQRAAEIDPDLAMAYWGMALARSTNYNVQTEENQAAAYADVRKAIELSRGAPKQERGYIDALAKRFAADASKAATSQLVKDYKEAMADLAKRYPDDLDAATLYAESAMSLNLWQLWTPDGQPGEGTLDILATLESVLRRNPDHPGANCDYIRAIEASPWPERGLAIAARLKTATPSAGQPLLLSSQIYLRTGDYAEANRTSEKALQADQGYIEQYQVKGIYPIMACSRELHLLAITQAMQGRHYEAKHSADQVIAVVAPHVQELPALEYMLALPALTQVRFHRWKDILASQAPSTKQTIASTLWHFAAGLAYIEENHLPQARKELSVLQSSRSTMSDSLTYGVHNTAKKVLAIPEAILEAKIALANKDTKSALDLLKKAVETEDGLNRNEPGDWPLPTREILGGVYLRLGQPVEAEKVFRADLERNRRNPRSLFGLMEALRQMGNSYARQLVQQEFDAAWQRSTMGVLRVEDL